MYKMNAGKMSQHTSRHLLALTFPGLQLHTDRHQRAAPHQEAVGECSPRLKAADLGFAHFSVSAAGFAQLSTFV
jgi:hypothetical protein